MYIRCKKIFITSSNGVDIGASCENIILYGSPYTEIGTKSKNITNVNGQNVTIANSVQDVEINGVLSASIGHKSHDIKILQGTQTATISNIGEESSNILISNGVSDFSIGNGCDGIYLSGTASKIKIGDYNENRFAVFLLRCLAREL